MTDSDGTTDPMAFADQVGQELFGLLLQRGRERLVGIDDMERFTALLAAALLPVAEILRNPVERGRDAAATADKMVEVTTRRLRQLLQPVVESRQDNPPAGSR